MCCWKFSTKLDEVRSKQVKWEFSIIMMMIISYILRLSHSKVPKFFPKWFFSKFLWGQTDPNMCVPGLLPPAEQKQRSAPLRGVNTITITASCRGGRAWGRGGGGRRMREALRADRERGQLWHDSDKLPCIYSNCVKWSSGCVVMCVFTVFDPADELTALKEKKARWAEVNEACGCMDRSHIRP